MSVKGRGRIEFMKTFNKLTANVTKIVREKGEQVASA